MMATSKNLLPAVKTVHRVLAAARQAQAMEIERSEALARTKVVSGRLWAPSKISSRSTRHFRMKMSSPTSLLVTNACITTRKKWQTPDVTSQWKSLKRTKVLRNLRVKNNFRVSVEYIFLHLPFSFNHHTYLLQLCPSVSVWPWWSSVDTSTQDLVSEEPNTDEVPGADLLVEKSNGYFTADFEGLGAYLPDLADVWKVVDTFGFMS